jgi:hypothetical protein
VVSSIGNNPFEVELLTTQYTTLLELLLQQKLSKIRGRINSGTHVGKMASPVQQIGVLEFKQPQGRYSPIVFQLPNYTRRWVYPNDRDVAVPVDTFDELRTIVDPKGGINMAVVAAGNRFFDDICIAAFFGAASTGVDSSNLSTETFPGLGTDAASTYLVASAFGASASTGMSYPKIVEAYRILEHYQALEDGEEVTLIMGSQQHADLKKQIEVINEDYGEKAVVENGMVTRIGGANLVFSERLSSSINGANIRACPFFVKSGMYLGLWRDMTTRIDNRIDLTSQPWQLYSMITAGATRLQLGKIVCIDAADTTGSDPTAP